jgi:hypothetical protein
MDRAATEADIAERQKIAAVIADLSALDKPDRSADAKIYCIMAVRNSDITYEARPGNSPGTVVTYYEVNGKRTHGTCSAPSYTGNHADALSLARQERDRRFEFGSPGPGWGVTGDAWAYAHLGDTVGEAEGCCNEPTAIAVAILQVFAERLA